jgi:hypothetical protein
MIATAIGKLTAKVLTRVRANSESKVGSGRICCNGMRQAPSLQIANHGISGVRAKGASARAQTGTQIVKDRLTLIMSCRCHQISGD